MELKISKKYDNLYEINESEIPSDIQVMINNNEVGAVLLRIIEVIGQDKIEELMKIHLFHYKHFKSINIDLLEIKFY